MTIRIKRLLFFIIGFLAGFAVWPLTEIVLLKQGVFSTYLMFSMVQGAILGMVPGLFFGGIDGILTKNRYKFKWGLVVGGIVGLIGGVIGGVISQNTLFMFQSSPKELFLSRVLGMGILGAFVGISDGIRSISLKKSFVGLLGGIMGGSIGGLVIAFFNHQFNDFIITRLIGIVIFTSSIGLFYALIEAKLSRGVLLVLNGPMKSREFNIGQRVLTLGSSLKCDIVLKQYHNLERHHITIKDSRGKLIIKNRSERVPMVVNDVAVNSHVLKYEDVIQLGELKFYFKSC